MSEPAKIDRVVERIKPLLAGQPPEIQGAVLADLLAIWLAGHRIIGEPGEGDRLRADLLEAHVKSVRQLVDLYLAGAGDV